MTQFIWIISVLISLFAGSLTKASLPEKLPPGDYTYVELKRTFGAEDSEVRRQAWPRAKVWKAPMIPIGQIDLSDTWGRYPFHSDDEIPCKFFPNKIWGSGQTEKFYCVWLDEAGRPHLLKVKYDFNGHSNGEVRSEIVSSRLLVAIGFGADTMYSPKTVRCFGCPPHPYKKSAISYDKYNDFDYVSIETKMAGVNLEEKRSEGWSFSELSKIQSSAGGSSAAEVDALRLLVAFIQSGDTKAGNQRLICLPGGWDVTSGGQGQCSQPFAFIQDNGANFGGSGGRKFNLRSWEKTTVWSSSSCDVAKPDSFSGPTFKAGRISEAGRVFLYRLLSQLTRPQIEGLFRGARVMGGESEVQGWTDEFLRRVAQLNSGNLRCPAVGQ